MNKELIASKFFKHLDDTALIGYSDFYDEVEDLIIDVRFDPNINSLKISLVEVLDVEWDVLPLESKELENYLKPLFNEWLKQEKKYKKQQKEILNDQKI